MDTPITSLQANAMVVDHIKCTLKYFVDNKQYMSKGDSANDKKIKVTTNILHDRLH